MKPTFDVIWDYDDVLYPLSSRAHLICEAAGITNGRTITSWSISDSYGITPEELWAVLTPAAESGELYTAWLIPGALEAMRRLRYAGHRNHVVTARGVVDCQWGKADQVQAFTRECVRRNNVPLDSLTFAKDKGLVAAELNASFAIDDGTHNYEDLADAGVQVYLMNTPHNQNFNQHRGTPVRRVESARAFTDIVLDAQDMGARWIEEVAA